MIEPIAVLTAISLGLKIVDQFRDLALRFSGKKVDPPSAIAEKKGETIQIKHNETVIEEVTVSQMHLSEWDGRRYQALERRIKSNWDLYNELYAELPGLDIEEQVRIKLRMERIQGELCTDFREMVRIYERTLAMHLPDHYSLYEVCGN